MRFRFHEFEDLAISEEHHSALLDDVLENEELVVVANIDYVRHNDVVKCCLILPYSIMTSLEIINFLLCHISIQDLLINPIPQ